MKSEAEIRAELRYWEGRLEGLKAANKDLSDRADTQDKKAVEAAASAMSLRWVLAETTKEG